MAFVTCNPQTLRYKEMDVLGNMPNTTADGRNTNGDVTTTTEHLPPLQLGDLTVTRLRVSNIRLDEHGQTKKWSSETWYSAELREIIRLGNEEDGYTRLTGILRKDPDPKLFYPPDGYSIELQPHRDPATNKE